MKIIEAPQGSGEWLKARLGIPTASTLDALVSPEGKIRTGQGPETYLYKKLCERLLGYSTENAGSYDMEQGAVLEREARGWYAFERDVEVREVGLCLTDDGRVGASPDGLVGEDGGLEIKCFAPENALRTLLSGEVPKDYVIQIQAQLWVTGRAWVDFVSYSRQWPALVVRVEPELKFQIALSEAVEAFYAKYDSLLARITAMRDAENAAKEAAYNASNAKANAGTRA